MKIGVDGSIEVAAVTAEATERLGLEPGTEAAAIVEASDVKIRVDG
jgi:molybdopterin-binding protein